MNKIETILNSNVSSEICPECSGNIISLNQIGEVVCSQCGLVINERSVDVTHSDKRAYTSQEKSQREHTGAPISSLLPDIGLTTVINKKDISDPDLKRAVKWNTRITWEKRNLLIATTELKRICTNLDLPNYIKFEAIKLYKEAFKKKLLRGRSINSMIAASIYLAIRLKKIPRTLQEILEESSENEKDIRRCYRVLIRELNIKSPNTEPSALIPALIAELQLNHEVEETAKKIVNTFSANFSTSGKDPKGIVAGALYLACKLKGLDLTQKQIADVVRVTEVTLRSRYKELSTKLKIKV
ncbi:MAG: transcription initiation factor IIB [Candidatus Lokiarchaeota archaeon]|nr:transcription initiation factor IIB [Candidatus Lokiarchaeota archaeon]